MDWRAKPVETIEMGERALGGMGEKALGEEGT